MVAAFLIALVLVICLWLRRPRRCENFPPGPPTFLLFGNLSAAIQCLTGNFRPLMKSSRQLYGDIVSFVFPDGTKAVHLFNFDDIKQACSKQDFSGRPNDFGFLVRSNNQKIGLVFNEGQTWSEHRRFALRQLRDMGVGKNSMELIILEEFEQLMEEMKREVGTPMNGNVRFHLTSFNVLWRLIANKRIGSSDPQFDTFINTVNEFVKLVGPQSPLSLAPWLRHFFPEWSGHAPLIRHRDIAAGMFQQLIREHQCTRDPDHPRDFIDRFLTEMEIPDAAARLYTEQNLTVIGMDFFIAGMETVATSLSWALLFMVMHPDVQKRVQREIDVVIGHRPVTYGNRTQLPYTEATVMEISRRVTIAPFALHSAMYDSTLGEYTIPQNTQLLVHLEAVHLDTVYWGDPETFRPDRFLKPDGTVRRDERLIPFGIGKRYCLGETLAKMEMFMLFTSLLQRFTFVATPGQTLSLETDFALINQPMQFFVDYELRD